MTCSNEEHRTLLVRRCSPPAQGSGPEAVLSEVPATGGDNFSMRGLKSTNKSVLIAEPNDNALKGLLEGERGMNG
jgi:hypothetical protein